MERCAGSSWFIDRTIDSRCVCRASIGKCSLIEIPGTLVGPGPVSEPIGVTPRAGTGRAYFPLSGGVVMAESIG